MSQVPHPNRTPTDDSFENAKPVKGRMYHIRGMYKGSFFRLLDFGAEYAVLGYPSKHSHKLFACKITDLKAIRNR